MATYSPQERAYYDQLFSVIDKDQSGVLPGQDALPFLVSSNLPQQTLGEVWALADPGNNGFLTRDAWYRAARLIGWMQKGGQTHVDKSLTFKAGPYPTFAGHAPPPQAPMSAQTTGQRQGPSSALPPLTAADRAKFTKLFVGCGPQNGLVSGEKARDVFIKSKLNYDQLGQIWTLADTQNRGSLDLPDFIIGMFLIQSCMANTSLNLPATLPPNVYEQASGGRPAPASPMARQNTGPASPIRPQYTGQMQPQALSAQNTGRSAFPPPKPPAVAAQWDIAPDAKATSDRFFAQLDPQNKGVIEGDVAVPFMLQSQLDEGSLASIWDLADIRKEGKLTKDEFAVAMYLINGKLAGRDVPSVLPNSLIPPSLRGEYSNQQEAPVSSVTKDLFDLFADDEPSIPASPTRSAPTSSFSTQSFLPPPPARKPTAPPPPPAPRAMSPSMTGASAASYSIPSAMSFRPQSNDLLGEDSAAPANSVPDRSAEIGNKQTQLASTERSVADLEKQRADLERSAQSTAAQLADIEQRLSSARVKHEAESKSVSDLRVRVGQQQDTIQKLNTDLISAESDLSAMRSEKDELEQALLRDKEEVRGLQKKMKEAEDEKTGLKSVLEKLKKEARQQKGMVSIAKKQLTTAEGSRDGVQGEIKAEEESLAAAAAAPPVESQVFSPTLNAASTVPLPTTPAALSPVPTGVSQRSNNPFDKLRNARSPVQETPTETGSGVSSALMGAGAAVGLAAGVVAAGASSIFEAAKHVVSPTEEVEKPLEQADVSRGIQDPTEHTEVHQPAHAVATEAIADHSAPQTETDPFGAGASDDFDVAPQAQAQSHVEVDPFGAPTSGGAPAAAQFDDFDSGFGDSFGASHAPAQAAPASKAVDFESDFADSFASEQTVQPAVVAPQHESYISSEQIYAPTQAATTAPKSDFDSSSADFGEAGSEGIPSGIPKSAVPYLRPDAERTDSTQAVAPESIPASPVATPRQVEPEHEPAHDDASSDEDDGPEDLDRPKQLYSSNTGGSQIPPPPPAEVDAFGAPAAVSTDPFGRSSTPASPETDLSQKTRRSAPPPPPSAKSSALAPPILDDFDPFGASSSPSAPAHTSSYTSQPQLPPGAAPPVQSQSTGNAFDEDDFDFSDQPPVKVDESAAHKTPVQAQNFRDDFDFDDEFEKPSTGQGSEASTTGMSKSYEMVSPPPPSFSQHGQGNWSAPGGSGQQGQGAVGGMSAPSSGFSFDDAFGNDFETQAESVPAQQQQQFSPPSGPPPGQGRSEHLAAPPLPQRRDSEAQPDDIEDVKKLCGMGFNRGLVVEALAANSYDFQKTLNVLLG